MTRFVALLAAGLLVSGCLHRSPPPIQHDPVRTVCGGIGLIRWQQADTASTVKAIKTHNAVRRALCPPDRYDEWYYSD